MAGGDDVARPERVTPGASRKERRPWRGKRYSGPSRRVSWGPDSQGRVFVSSCVTCPWATGTTSCLSCCFSSPGVRGRPWSWPSGSLSWLLPLLSWQCFCSRGEDWAGPGDKGDSSATEGTFWSHPCLTLRGHVPDHSQYLAGAAQVKPSSTEGSPQGPGRPFPWLCFRPVFRSVPPVPWWAAFSQGLALPPSAQFSSAWLVPPAWLRSRYLLQVACSIQGHRSHSHACFERCHEITLSIMTRTAALARVDFHLFPS